MRARRRPASLPSSLPALISRARASRARRARATFVALLYVATGALAVGCRAADARPLGRAERAAIADSIARQVTAAYNLSAPNVVERMASLYPATGGVISASGGRVVASRDSVRASIQTFWDNVGRNMRAPTWEWTSMRVDVLAPNAAVMTATYRIPHHTPSGRPHVLGGAWTAVFERRDGRWVIIHEHLSDLPPDAAQPAAGAAPQLSPVDSAGTAAPRAPQHEHHAP